MWRRTMAGVLALAMKVNAADSLSLSAVWDSDSGLPHPVLTAVLQTGNGDLWCGTYYGLARFDGVRFTIFDEERMPEQGGRGVTALFEDREGRLWAGLAHGAVCRWVNRDRFETLPIGKPGIGEVGNIAQDQAGDVWVLWRNGVVVRVRDGLRLECPPEVDKSGPELELVNDHQGRLWLVNRLGFHEVKPEGLKAAEAGISGEIGGIQRATAASRGGMWVVVNQRLRRWMDGQWVEDLGPGGWVGTFDGEAGRFVTAIRELKDGRLLVGMIEGGAAVGAPGGEFQIFGTAEGMTHEWVRCVAEDREGNLWLGTGGGGLAALRPRRVRMVEVENDGTRHNLQGVSATRDGGLWAGTEGGGAWRLKDGVSEEGVKQGFHRVESGGANYVWSVNEDRDGRVWLGSWDGDLMVLPDGGERFEALPGWAEGGGPIRIVMPASDGTVWVGGGRDLTRIRDGIWSIEDADGRPLSPPRQQVLAEDAGGGVWIGLEDGRVALRRGGELTVYGTGSGLPGNAISAMLPREDGSLWLGTMGGGLVRFRDGRAVAITAEDGFPAKVVAQLVADESGFLWAGTPVGICRMSLDELDARADGHGGPPAVLVLSRSDGMATSGCSSSGFPGVCRAADGKLWFTTTRGLAVVDPEAIQVNRLPPPVVIESLAVDGHPVAIHDEGELEFGPGSASCAIGYTGLSFTAPERVRFRTRLEGMEEEWQEAGTEREAVYRYLRPGAYRFQVMACNNDGIWNETGAEIRFMIRSHWWQRAWFQVLAGLAGAVLIAVMVGGMARRRNARRLARIERGHALERERARIARDIHDDLGSGLTRIMLLSRQAREEIDPDSPARGEVDQIGRAAEKLTQAMDEIVWAVDPRHDSLDSMVGYVGSAAQELLSTAGIRFRLEAPADPPDWQLSADRRHSLFLAFKEALHNVVRHAGAETVKVVFAIEDRAFTLSVEDDGQGFDPADPQSRVGGGRGLEHLGRRLAEIGGTCEVTSRAGSGTKVSFRIPMEGPAVSSKVTTR